MFFNYIGFLEATAITDRGGDGEGRVRFGSEAVVGIGGAALWPSEEHILATLAVTEAVYRGVAEMEKEGRY